MKQEIRDLEEAFFRNPTYYLVIFIVICLGIGYLLIGGQVRKDAEMIEMCNRTPGNYECHLYLAKRGRRNFSHGGVVVAPIIPGGIK